MKGGDILKKMYIFVVLVLISTIALSSCGKTYKCTECERTVSKAYRGVEDDEILCSTCAEEYWAPINHQKYQIK